MPKQWTKCRAASNAGAIDKVQNDNKDGVEGKVEMARAENGMEGYRNIPCDIGRAKP